MKRPIIGLLILLFGLPSLAAAPAAPAPPLRIGVMAFRTTAQAVLDALKAAPERFAELAGQYSNCPSGALGGSLGQISPGQSVPEFFRRTWPVWLLALVALVLMLLTQR